jgi:hypothetical protein
MAVVRELMQLTLMVGVPLCMHKIKSTGGPFRSDIKRAHEFAEILAEKGDVLQYGSRDQGEVANLMAQLIEAVAILACLPGGVDVFGMHWET